jgi:hypothetical protein
MDTIICCHCNKPCQKNPRNKNQKYCSSAVCQQARKNSWERSKLQSDPEYKESRRKQKLAWYKNKPGDRYQSTYRLTHPDYRQANKEKQRPRNREKAKDASVPKIVKTDASAAKSGLEGSWYALIPYGSFKDKKIVKTEALIVQIVDTELYKGANNRKERWKR